MNWLSAIAALIGLIGSFTSFLRDRNLIETGEAQAINAALKGALDNVAKAQSARAAVRNDPGSVSGDPDNRDR
jgi:hypothetical protein